MSRGFKSVQTINDPILEPFFITKDDYGFTVKERILTNAKHFRSKSSTEGKYEKSIGYYPHFSQCLMKIAELKLDQKENYQSINQYLTDFKDIKNQIQTYINQ